MRTVWHVRGLRERILQLRGRYILLRVLWLQPISHSIYKQLWWENSDWLSNEGGLIGTDVNDSNPKIWVKSRCQFDEVMQLW